MELPKSVERMRLGVDPIVPWLIGILTYTFPPQRFAPAARRHGCDRLLLVGILKQPWPSRNQVVERQLIATSVEITLHGGESKGILQKCPLFRFRNYCSLPKYFIYNESNLYRIPRWGTVFLAYYLNKKSDSCVRFPIGSMGRTVYFTCMNCQYFK